MSSPKFFKKKLKIFNKNVNKSFKNSKILCKKKRILFNFNFKLNYIRNNNNY